MIDQQAKSQKVDLAVMAMMMQKVDSDRSGLQVCSDTKWVRSVWIGLAVLILVAAAPSSRFAGPTGISALLGDAWMPTGCPGER